MKSQGYELNCYFHENSETKKLKQKTKVKHFKQLVAKNIHINKKTLSINTLVQGVFTIILKLFSDIPEIESEYKFKIK